MSAMYFTSYHHPIRVLYKEPLKIFGKQVALDRIIYPHVEYGEWHREEFSFKVLMDTEHFEEHTVYVNPARYSSTKNLIWAMKNALDRFQSRMGMSNQRSVVRLRHPKSENRYPMSDHRGSSEHGTVELDLENTGFLFPVLQRGGVIPLFSTHNLQMRKLTVPYQHIENYQSEEDELLQIPAYLYCSIVAPSLVNDKEKRLLACLLLTQHNNNIVSEIVVTNPIYVDVVLEDILHVKFTIEGIDGTGLIFDTSEDPITIVLRVK